MYFGNYDGGKRRISRSEFFLSTVVDILFILLVSCRLHTLCHFYISVESMGRVIIGILCKSNCCNVKVLVQKCSLW